MDTCRVERAPYNPNRDFKLTRLVQDSMKALGDDYYEEISAELNDKSVESEATNAKLSETEQKIVQEIDAEEKEFKGTLFDSIEEIAQKLETCGSGHVTECSNPQQKPELHLNTRAEHLNSLGETLNKHGNDQAKTIGDLHEVKENMIVSCVPTSARVGITMAMGIENDVRLV